MIEKYSNIKFFTPIIFQTNLINDEKDFYNNLQNFANFITKEYFLNNIYEIVFSSNDMDEQAHLDIEKKQIIISNKELNNYIKCLSTETLNDNHLMQMFPCKIMSIIVHEMEHAKQLEEYKINNQPEYATILNSFPDIPMYILQQTEIEAYKTQIDELEKFADIQSNIEYKSLILEYKNNLKDNFNYYMKKSFQMLEDLKLLEGHHLDINFDNINDNLTVFQEIQEIIQKELIYLKEYQDILRDDNRIKQGLDSNYINDYIKTNNEIVKYKIKNENNKWNGRININNKELYFTLEDRELRINQIEDNNKTNNFKLEKEDENKLFSYLNAFVELYPGKIEKVKMSNLIYKNYDNKIEFINNHKTMKNNFTLNKFMNVKNIATYNNVKNSLNNHLDFIIAQNRYSAITQTKLIKSRELEFEK